MGNQYSKITLLDYVYKSIDSHNNSFDCLIWPYGKLQKGYGVVSVEGKIKRVTRIALEYKLNRSIKQGMFACHTCHNPSCYNPQHLYEGTQKQNLFDRIKDGTNIVGERNGRSKITLEQVNNIRNSNMPSRKIAKEYGISKSQVLRIRRNQNWKYSDSQN